MVLSNEITSKCDEVLGKSYLKLYCSAPDGGHLDPGFPEQSLRKGWEPVRSLGRKLLEDK